MWTRARSWRVVVEKVWARTNYDVKKGNSGATKVWKQGFCLLAAFHISHCCDRYPPCILAESAFPTPLPPPSWRARWKGDWWVVPAGMMTSSSSCSQWGPLTPAWAMLSYTSADTCKLLPLIYFAALISDKCLIKVWSCLKNKSIRLFWFISNQYQMLDFK